MNNSLNDAQEHCRQIMRAAAKSRNRASYGQLGAQLGMHPISLDQRFLNPIAKVERALTGHDTTLVAFNQERNIPSRFDGQPLGLDQDERVQKYFRALESLWDYWRSNPDG